jgi:Large eukaryotic DNA virus major capsid protein
MVMSGGNAAGITGDVSDASLWVDYIFLDTDERRRMAQLSHEYLIEQLQFTGDEGINTSAAGIKLNFNHPVKELIFMIRKTSDTSSNNWITYSDSTGANNVSQAKLQLNGQDRFYVRNGSYFNLVQPFCHHENVSANTGINVYSFALKPEEHQPSGTLNFSRIDTAVMQLNMGSEAASGAILKTYAINYNVLRIMSGINENCFKKTLKLILACAKQSAANDGYCSTILDKQCKRSLVYNWLVDRNICNKTKLSGTPFRALTTTSTWKRVTGTQGNDLGYSKNVKDWVIRSQAPAVLNALDRVKVQRIDGFGGERNAILREPLRYIPALYENTGIKTGAVLL